MQYLMLVCVDPDHTAADEAAAPDIDEWLAAAGTQRVMGERLRPRSDAKTVRVRDGRTLVTDGPFAETKEWIVGFDLLDCPGMDAAIAVAARHPLAYTGRIEVRAFWPFEEEQA